MYPFALHILNIWGFKYDSNVSLITVAPYMRNRVLRICNNTPHFLIRRLCKRATGGAFQSLGHHQSDLGAVKDERRPAA